MKRILLTLTLLLAATPFRLTADERELRLDRGDVVLEGTLRTPPEGCGTVLLVIAGSGPTDRDGNQTAQGLYTDSYLLLAEALEDRGIATLRYDKRGVGASFYRTPEAIRDIVFDDYVADAKAWAARLRDEGFARVVLAGHSEGALVALCAADETGAPAPEERNSDTAGIRQTEGGRSADALVLIAGPSEPIDRILLEQLAPQCSPGTMFRLVQLFERLRRGEISEEYPSELAPLFLPYLQRYFMSQMRYDACELAARSDLPMLLIYGGNDLQVPPRHGERLRQAARHATLVVVPGMTHTLKQSDGVDAAGQAAAYMDARLPLDGSVAEAVASFVREP